MSDRASGAVLEGLPSEVEAQASTALKESGKGGTGRYVVGEDDVEKALTLINAAHAARVRAIQAKQATDKPKAESKPSGAVTQRGGGQARRETRVTLDPRRHTGASGRRKAPVSRQGRPAACRHPYLGTVSSSRVLGSTTDGLDVKAGGSSRSRPPAH